MISSAARMVLAVGLAAILLATPVVGAEQVEISFATWQLHDWYEEIIPEFHEAYPNIRVEYRPMHWGGWTNYTEQIVTQFVGGVAADVMNLPALGFPSVAGQGILMPLDELIDRDRVEFDFADFLPVAQEAMRWDGRTYGITQNMGIWMAHFNEDKFAEGGLSNPVQLARGGAWTWDAMIDSTKRLARFDNSGENTQWGMITYPEDAGIYPFVWGHGGRLLSEDGTESLIGEPEAVAGIAQIQELMYRDRALAFPWFTGVPQRAPWPESINSGSFGLLLWWATLTASFEGLQWESDEVPIPPGPNDPNTVPVQFNMISMSAQTQKREAAWEFVKFITGKEQNAGMMALSPGRVPSRASLLPEYFDLQRREWSQEGTQLLLNSINRARLVPQHQEFGRINDLNRRHLRPIWTNDEDPNIALQELDRQIDLLLAQPQ